MAVSLAKSTRGILRAMLSRLPADPDSIAGFFGDRGIRGVRNNSECCPVAHWLNVSLGGVYTPEVLDSGTVTLYYEGVPAARADLPVPVYDFVRLFDEGIYPLLIADE
jgi:hypothetical protein